MRRTVIVVAAATALLAGGTAFGQFTGTPDAPLVYVSSPDDGTIFEISSVSPAAILYADGSFEDLVYGPDELLYACVPRDIGELGLAKQVQEETGVIVRFDPTDPEGPVQLVHDGTDGPLYQPQCGWFTHAGDLVVTDQFPGSGVWLFEGIASVALGDPVPSPTNLLDAGDLVETFVGSGVTQAADGDLLFVDQANDAALSLPFHPIDGFRPDVDPVLSLCDTGPDPIGIARLSTGEIFVTTPAGLTGYQATAGEGGKEWLAVCDIDQADLEDESCGEDAFGFLEATANDWLYLATTRTCQVCEECIDQSRAALWAVAPDPDGDGDIADCEAQPVWDGEYGEWYASSAVGVAVPATGRTIDEPTGGLTDLEFDFSDHVYRIVVPDGCQPAMRAQETPPGCLQKVLDTLVYEGEFDGTPVTYLGEKGFGTVYYLTSGGLADDVIEEQLDPCQPIGDELIEHFLSAFTDAGALTNPKIIRCEGYDEDLCDPTDEVQPDFCEPIDLDFQFPLDGDLPGDGSFGGFSPDFSQYFLVNTPLANGGVGNACFCGFEPPLTNSIDRLDPGLTDVKSGSSLPVKFRLGTPDGGVCDCGNKALTGDPVVRLAIARVLPDFELMQIECTGNKACPPPVTFPQPKNPRSGYHLEIKTNGYPDGTYVVSAVSPAGDFVAAFTYLRVFTK